MEFNKLINQWVQDLTPYQPGKPIAELQREIGIKDIVKLASNENPLGPSPKAIAAIEDLNNLDLSRYPDGNGFYLKEAIAEKYNLKFEQITLGNGSDDIFNFIVRAFLAPKDKVIIDEYAFAAFPIAVKAVGANIIKIPSKNYIADVKKMVSMANSEFAKIIYLANPNNPTGTMIKSEDFEYLLANIDPDIIIVVDEAYFEYAIACESGYPKAFNYLDKYPNLIVTHTFSKAFGLAGTRVGFSASNLAIVDILNRIRLPFNVNSVGLVGACAALTDDEHINNTITVNQQGLDFFYSELKKMDLNYISSSTNFVTIDTKGSGIELFNKLLHLGVIVRPLGPYGMPLHLRVSVGTESENKKFFRAFKKVLAK